MARKKETDPLRWLDRTGQLALAQWKQAGEADGTAVYLVNPAVRKPIRRYLTEEIWPAARATLTARGFDLLGADDPIVSNRLSIYCDFIAIATDLVGAPNNALTYQRLAKQVNILFENEVD